MLLSRIKITNFKNYNKANIDFDQKVNIIYGDNGSGKTNFLDAIHYLSVSKSYFSLSDKYLIKDEEDFFRVEGNYKKESKSDLLVIKYKRDQRRIIQLNHKKLAKVNDLIGRYPIVLIAPDDIRIVNGGSKERRDYFNKFLCQSDPDYLRALMTYNRLLRQKDALLKSDYQPDQLAVEAHNHKMIPLAITLHETIIKSIAKFAPNAQSQYEAISQGKDMIAVGYASDLTDRNIEDLFFQMIPQEIAARRPLVGLQRDDYSFLIKDRPFKKYGSQGQIKTLLYSLRLAEFSYLTEHLKDTPILILDDFFEKLDKSRLSALLTILHSPSFGQVFLSDTELTRSQEIFEQHGINYAAYHVDEGNIVRTK